MTPTTQTGIPINSCDICGHRHTAGRAHCVGCGVASAFIDPASGMCLRCLNGPVPS